MTKRRLKIVVGFGAELPHGASIDTAWGVLRARRPQDTELFRAAVLDSEFDVGRGSVLEAYEDDPWGTLPDGRRSLMMPGIEDERWKRVALALLLVQEPSSAKGTLPWCCVQTLDGGGGGSAMRQFRKGPEITDELLPVLAEWLARVENPRLSSIAIDRTTLMAHRLVDHVDALIDGVIVWENLFGTGDTQELSYRVSMNMACVLSTDPVERVPYQDEIKRLYNLRSKIVHGGYHPRSGEDKDKRDRIQELTLRAVGGLLADYPQLVAAKPEKFMAFILGAGLGGRST